jgi:hypothetical protein
VLSGKKEFHEQSADRRVTLEVRDRRHRTLLMRYTGHFIVVGKFRRGFVTDVECYNGRLLIVPSAGRDWLGDKDVMKQHREYENCQQSHKNTILKKESTVNAKGPFH